MSSVVAPPPYRVWWNKTHGGQENILPHILLRIYLVDLRMTTKEKVKLSHFVENLHSVNSILLFKCLNITLSLAVYIILSALLYIYVQKRFGNIKTQSPNPVKIKVLKPKGKVLVFCVRQCNNRNSYWHSGQGCTTAGINNARAEKCKMLQTVVTGAHERNTKMWALLT